MKTFKHPRITKRFALRAAAYRRSAKANGQQKMSFTIEDLDELFLFESCGVRNRSFDEMKRTNGFAYGKWVRDLSVAMMLDDISRGDFCKAEFLASPIQRLHNGPILRGVCAPTWFPYDRS